MLRNRREGHDGRVRARAGGRLADLALLAAVATVAIVGIGAGIRASDRMEPTAVGQFAAGVVVRGEAEAERTDEPEKAMQRFLRERSPDGKAISLYPRYQLALEQMESMQRHSAGRSSGTVAANTPAATLPGTWTQLGPGNIGGRTRALVIAPGDGNTMYAGAVAGGVWKTTNGGTSWTPLDDFMPNLAVNSLAMDPNNPLVLYAGTGEGFFNGDAVRGAGIFKTTNGGTTWTPVGGTDTNAEFHYVNDVVVSKGNSQHVFAATRDGVFRSLDGGANWSEATVPNFNNGCMDLAIRTDVLAGAAATVFASCGTFEQARIYRNTDAGAAGGGTWVEVYTELHMGRTSLAIAPSNQNFIYALSESVDPASNFEHGLFKVLRSTTGGGAGGWATQAQVTSPATMVNALLSNPRELFRSNCSGQGTTAFYNQGWYDNVIAVDPVNENVVFAGGVDLFRSDNGGVAWGHISRWDRAPVVHADQHVIAFHPGYDGIGNKTMFVGNDGGIHKTTDARATSRTDLCSPYSTTGINVAWSHLNNGYAVTQFYDGTAFPNGTQYIGGTQDNGTVRGADGTGIGGWFEEVGGDGGYVAVNPTNTQIMYAESQGFFFQRTTDGGTNWVLKNTLPRTNNCDFSAGGECMPFITPFSIDSVNPTRLYTGGWYAYRTVNQGDNWVQVGPVTPGAAETSAIATHPANPELLLVGMTDGWVGRLTNASTATSATAWATTTQPRPGYVTSFGFHPTDPNIAYATYSTFGEEHVWKTDDAGQTWISIDGSGAGTLPDIPVHSIVVDPVNPQTLYIGTDLGIFVSTDDGANWAVENTGFANVVTEKLEIRGSGANRTLFAFTHGRSAWRTPIVAAATAPGAPTDVSATAGYAQAQVSWTAPVNNGGSAVTNYIVTPYVGVTPQPATEVGNVTSATITGLTGGTGYKFTVKAKNAIGTGLESPLSAEVTLLPAFSSGLISNGSFESSLTGWSTYRANATRVSGGPAGAFAARVSFIGPGTGYAFTTSPRPVTSTSTGQVYEAGASARSETPGDRLCLVLREWSSTNTVLGLSTSCLTATSAWQAFPPLQRTTTGSGGSMEVYVEQGGAVAGDSFDLDAVSLTLQAPPEPGNLIANGGFESSLSGWSTYRANAARVSGGAVGSWAARVNFTGPGTGYAFTTSPRPVTNTAAGQVYEAGARVRSEAPGDRLCLVLREWSSTNTVLGISTSCLNATGGWQSFPTLQRTTTGSGGSLELYVEQGGALAGDSFDLDAVYLTVLPPPEPGNLIANGGFESSTVGWSTYRATAARVAGGAAGASAARVSFTGPGTGYAFTTSPRPVTNTTAGQIYEAGASARSETPGDRLCLVLREFSSTNTVLGLSTSCLTATGAWQAFPPLQRTATGSGGSLELYVEQGGALAGDSFDLDAVVLALQPPPEPGNLIANGGFESTTAGWSTYRASAARVAGGATGSFSARVTFAGPGTGYAFTTSPRPVTSTTAGQLYQAGASARSEVPGDRLCLVLREFSSTNTVLGLNFSCLTATGAWQAFPPLQRTTTGNGGSLELYVEQGNALAGDSFDLDAVSLTQP